MRFNICKLEIKKRHNNKEYYFMETKIENLGLILLLLASSDNLETVNPTLYDNVKKELLNDNTKKYIKGLVFEHLCMHK